MSFSISSPVTGAPIASLLTSPTYTLTQDQAVDSNVRAYYVSALGGTQNSVDVHALNKPFQISFAIPKVLKTVTSGILLASGLIQNTPRNTYVLTTRKGASVNSVGGTGLHYIKTTMDIAVQAETQDAPNLAAALSLHFGVVYANAPAMLTAMQNGAL